MIYDAIIIGGGVAGTSAVGNEVVDAQKDCLNGLIVPRNIRIHLKERS